MLKKFLLSIGTAALTACGILFSAIGADAATIDEVAETARRLGFPESAVQQGLNQYYEDPEMYTPDMLDDAIVYLYNYEDELKSQLGISVSSSSTAQESSKAESMTSSESNDTQASSSAVQETNQSNGNTSVIPNKPSASDFINMTLDEKRDYVSTLTPDEQQQFFNSLSADELKSIVKQLPTNDKASVVDSFVQAGEAMGIKVTVDEINDDGISMSMRNNDGKLIDVASVGVIVEDTGYDHRAIFAFSGSLILLAFGGLWLVLHRCFGRGAEVEDEE